MRIRQSLFLVALLSIFVSISTFSSEVEDVKYLLAFMFFPAIAAIFMRSKEYWAGEDIAKEATCWWPVLMIGLWILYGFANWSLLSHHYYGVRGMALHWVCQVSFLGGCFILTRPAWNQVFGLFVVIAASVASIYSFLEYLAFIPYFNPNHWPPRVSGLMGHKNPFGLLAIWGVIWGLILIDKSRKRYRTLFIVAIILQMFALFCADSRGTLVLLAIASTAYLIPIALKRGWLRRTANRYILYAVIFLMGTIPILFWSDYHWYRIALLAIPDSELVRNSLYTAGFRAFNEHPFFGAGIGNFVHSTIPFWPEELKRATSAFFFPRNAENEYLEILLETGILGLSFFLVLVIGAVIFGIQRLRKGWDQKTWGVIVLVLISLLNGFYDTALRRITLASLFWAAVGYFWGNLVQKSTWRLHARYRLYAGGFGAAIHVVIAFLFVQVIVSDYYYRQSYSSQRNPHAASGRMLTKALTICPYNPDALFQTAFISVQAGKYEYAAEMASVLDSVAPNLRPTKFISALSLFAQGENHEALLECEAAIQDNPTYLDPYELKVRILAKLAMCSEANRIRDSLTIPLHQAMQGQSWYDTVTAVTIQNEYMKSIGQIRANLGGKHLKNAYYRYLEISRDNHEKFISRLKIIAAIRCGDNL